MTKIKLNELKKELKAFDQKELDSVNYRAV